MKKILILIISVITLYSCGCAKIKSTNGVFKDNFQCDKNSPWVNKSKRHLSFEPIEKTGLKISNTSEKYHTGVNYEKFPVNMLNDFETKLNFSVIGDAGFTFYLGYKDSKHRDLFTFFKKTKRFNYSRYDNTSVGENNFTNCILKEGVNTFKLIKKNNRITVIMNDIAIMQKDNRPTFSNSFGFGLGPETSVILRNIEISDTNYINQ